MKHIIVSLILFIASAVVLDSGSVEAKSYKKKVAKKVSRKGSTRARRARDANKSFTRPGNRLKANIGQGRTIGRDGTRATDSSNFADIPNDFGAKGSRKGRGGVNATDSSNYADIPNDFGAAASRNRLRRGSRVGAPGPSGVNATDSSNYADIPNDFGAKSGGPAGRGHRAR